MNTKNNYYFNTRHKAVYKLLVVANNYEYKLQQILKPHQVTLPQYSLLRILKHSHPLPTTIMSIRNDMIDKMSDVTRLVERMYKSGLITKKASLEDKRVTEVYISEKGEEILYNIEASIQKAQIMGNLSEEKVTQLYNLLNELVPHK